MMILLLNMARPKAHPRTAQMQHQQQYQQSQRRRRRSPGSAKCSRICVLLEIDHLVPASPTLLRTRSPVRYSKT